MRNPFSKREKALTADPAVLTALDGGWSPYPLLGGGSRQRIQEAYNVAKSANYPWLYSKSPSLRMVIECIVRNAGQLEMRLYEELSAAERQPRPEHPAALSLRYPSESVSSDKFIRQMFKDFLIYDDATALMTEAPGRQITFNWIPFNQMEIRGAGLFEADEYRYWRPDGTHTDFPTENIFHWHGENPSDPRIGLSHLDTLRDVLAEEIALRQAVTELGNSGLSETVWAYRPLDAPAMGKPAQDAFGEDLTNKVRARNRQVIVTQEGTELRSFGVNPRDAQMLELRHAILVQVAAEYGLPLGMLSEEPTEQARTVFLNDCLAPLCENFTRFTNQRVLVRVYNWTEGCFEFYLDEKRMGNDTLKALVSATGRPVMLTNEGRARLNLPPVDTGDELVTPANVIVGDNPKPSVDIMPIQDPNAPPQDGSHRIDQEVQTRALNAFTEEMRRQLSMAKQISDPTAGGHEEYQSVTPLHPRYRGDLERAHQNIDRAKNILERHYARLERSLTQKAATNWDRWDRELTDDLDGLVGAIVATEGDLYAKRFLGEFDAAQTTNYVRALAEGAATAINAKARQEIQDFGTEKAVARFAQHIESGSAGIGGGATRWAREEAARQSPNSEGRVKVWVPDTERHASYAGDRAPVDGPWPSGFAPGTAPGCKCTMSIE
jgi:HK97 family phage portal protein